MVAHLGKINARNDPLVGLNQVHHVDVFHVVLALGLLRERGAATGYRPSLRELLAQTRKFIRGGAVLLIRKQLLDELKAWVSVIKRPALAAFTRSARTCRRQRSTLNFHQRGGHHQELASNINVNGVQLLQERKVLLSDLPDRNIRNIHLRPTDQEEEQVHGTLKTVEPHLIIVLERHCGKRTARRG